MRYYLMKMKTYGVKSLEKEIELFFHSETIHKSLKIQGFNVKSIFGMNGAGKSAIMNSVDLYQKFSVIKNPIDKLTNEYLDNMFNKKTRSFSCEMTYALYDEKKDNKILSVYSHMMKVDKINNEYKFVYERLQKLVGTTVNGNYRTVYEVINGELEIFNHADSIITDYIHSKTLNLLDFTSLLSLCPAIFGTKDFGHHNLLKSFESIPEVFSPFLIAFMFPYNLYVFLDEEDQHQSYTNNLEDLVFLLKKLGHNALVNSLTDAINCSPNVNTKRVKIDDASEYEREVRRLEQFIRIFKPSLKSISTEKKLLKDYYQYTLIFNYEDYSIDSDFESTGIKKLIRLFQYIHFAAIGKIVFIDSLDANIHDVYLRKLIQYMASYGKGQLCYTSHNLGTLNELKNLKNSIDFLSEPSQIVPWKRNGNYSPYHQYRNGYIMGSAFNVEEFEFLKIFDTKEQ